MTSPNANRFLVPQKATIAGTASFRREVSSEGIADEASVPNAALHAELENIPIQLGNLQLASQIVNPRTETWVWTFQSLGTRLETEIVVIPGRVAPGSFTPRRSQNWT